MTTTRLFTVHVLETTKGKLDCEQSFIFLWDCTARAIRKSPVIIHIVTRPRVALRIEGRLLAV